MPDAATIKHCDDYIDDPTAPDALRKFLAFARAPAHGQLLPKPHPMLFADHEGRRVRVTTNFAAEFGYECRVPVSQLGNFSSEKPSRSDDTQRRKGKSKARE